MIVKDFKILYLDQFASSNLALEKEGIWSELKSLLDTCVETGKILCPTPYEHFLETSQAKQKHALEIDKYFLKLSKGFMFKTTAYTTSQLIISMLRRNNLTFSTFIAKRIKEDILTNNNELDLIKNRKNNFDKMIEEGTSMSNKMREVRNGQKIEKEAKKNLYNAISHVAKQEFIERLNDLLKEGKIEIRGDKFSFIEVPNWIDQTIFRLVKVHKMNPKETYKLISIIQKYGFSKFSTLNIRFSLYAIMSIENKKENSGDHIDIERIASGLPVSDYFFTDKQRKSEIISLGLDTKYDTKVYSGTQTDLNSVKDELMNILN